MAIKITDFGTSGVGILILSLSLLRTNILRNVQPSNPVDSSRSQVVDDICDFSIDSAILYHIILYIL